MTFRVGRILIHCHILLPLFLLIVMLSGAGEAAMTAFVCLLFHEAGHMIAALILGEQVLSLTLMPMGGQVHIGGLYSMPASRLLLIAFAGPFASFLLAVIGIMFPRVFSLRFVLINLTLALFNMLPVAPLDGGRMMTALLRRKIGIRKSIQINVCSGKLLAFLLLMGSFAVMLFKGHIPLALTVIGIYIAASAGQEENICELSAAEDIRRLLTLNRIMHPLPVQLYCCPKDTAPEHILSVLRPDLCTILQWQGENTLITDIEWLDQHLHT